MDLTDSQLPNKSNRDLHSDLAKQLPPLVFGGRTVEVSVGKTHSAKEHSPTRRDVDICFVFDATGSMADKRDGLVNCMSDFVGHLARLNLDWRVTVVPFGDLNYQHLGDRIVADLPFTSTRDETQQLLRSLPEFNGGGNDGESSLEAMQAAMNRNYRAGAVKILVLLTDEPPLETWLTVETIGRLISQREFICFAVGPDPRIQGRRVEGFRDWARRSGGRWYPISSTMPTAKLLQLLKPLVQEIPTVANRAVEAGSVKKFLELEGR